MLREATERLADLDPGRRRAVRALLVAIGLAFALALPAAVSADPGDVGFQGPSGSGAGAAPTGSKPQAKLWYNDGFWWASMWDVGTSDFYIWKLDRTTETWNRTNTVLDDRNATRADVLWDGTKLYVASHNFSEGGSAANQSRLYRYSYNTSTDTYSLDGGFPALINNVQSETLVIDKDSTGKLWATWRQGSSIMVNRTTTAGVDNAWGTPFVLAATGSDDISSLIAFNGNRIGLMWSNQNSDTDFFSYHIDGQADTTWSTPEAAYGGAGTNLADDHINLKTDSSGKVYAVVKTSDDPLNSFLVRQTNGTWNNYPVGTDANDHTRPILVVDQANNLFRVYMTLDSSGGPIVEKTSSMSGTPSFPTGNGTTVIWDMSSDDMNNATSTKQNVTSQTGLIVMAYEDTQQRYWHGDIFGGGGADVTPPTVTNRVPAASATNVAFSTNVTATFSEAVTGVSGSTFTLEGPGSTPVAATVTYNAGNQTATLDPDSNLAPSTTYTARLLSGITDTSPNANALVPLNWTFTTAAQDLTPPTVTNRVPAPSATDVSVGTNVTATFSEPVTGVNGSTFTLEGPGSTPVAATVTYSAGTMTVTLDPSANLAQNTTYTARLLAGIQDTASVPNPLAPVTWTFTTGTTPAGPVFKSASSGNNATATSLVIAKPAGVVQGDVMLASVAARGGPTLTGPAGWTLVRFEASGGTIRQAIFVKVAGASEPVSYSFGLSTAASAAGGIVAYSGVDTTTPIDTSGGQANASSTLATAPSITTGGPNRMLVTFYGIAVNTTFTPPGGMTERFDQQVPAANQYKVTASADDQLLTSGGPTGTRVATAANAQGSIGQAVALNPGSSGPPPPDTTPPTVTNRVPAPNATDVAVGSNVTATFSEDVTGVSGTTFTLEGPGPTSIPAAVTYDGPTRVATLNPNANLANGTTYTATLTSGITDLATVPNALVQVQWTFTTAAAPPPDTTPPTVTNRVPAPNATDVAVGSNVTATFSEDVTGVSGTTFTLEGPGPTSIPAAVTYDGPTRVATLNPNANLANGTTYTATLTSGITDLATVPNALVQVQWTFTTAAAPPPDTTPPTVTNRVPAPNATDVAVGSNVTATFSEDVTGVSGTTFTLEGPGPTSIPAAVTYDGPTRVATLNPNANLANGTTYTATLTSGITDLATVPNALVQVQWTFTTAAAPPAGNITFRGASSANNPTATTIVIPKPAGVVAGDAMLAAVAFRGNPTITPPAGWTLVRQDVNGNTHRQSIFVKVAGGSEPASYTFTLSAAQSAAGGIVAYSGVDPNTPVDVHGGQVNAASTSATAPSISTTGPNRMVVAFYATPNLTTFTAPGGMTERYDQQVPAANQYKVTASADDQLVTPSGPTGTRVATVANSAASVAGIVALLPAVGG